MKIVQVFFIVSVLASVVVSSTGVYPDTGTRPHARRLECEEPPPTGGGVSVCFSSDSIVYVRDKGPVPIANLSVGEEILVGWEEDNKLCTSSNTTEKGKFQKVYAFAHHDPTTEALFLQIYTNLTDHPLEVTPQHLLFLHGKGNPVRARSIQVLDHLVGGAGYGRNYPQAARVIKIRRVVKKGLYAPLTHDGTILVQGLQASSYVSLQTDADEYVEFQGGISSGVSQHHAIHMSLGPFRLFCRAFPSSQHCLPRLDTGMPNYVQDGIQLARWLDQLGYATQKTMFWPYLFVVGSAMLLEHGIVGASFSPLDVFRSNEMSIGYVVSLSQSSLRTKQLRADDGGAPTPIEQASTPLPKSTIPAPSLAPSGGFCSLCGEFAPHVDGESFHHEKYIPFLGQTCWDVDQHMKLNFQSESECDNARFNLGVSAYCGCLIPTRDPGSTPGERRLQTDDCETLSPVPGPAPTPTAPQPTFEPFCSLCGGSLSQAWSPPDGSRYITALGTTCGSLDQDMKRTFSDQQECESERERLSNDLDVDVIEYCECQFPSDPACFMCHDGTEEDSNFCRNFDPDDSCYDICLYASASNEIEGTPVCDEIEQRARNGGCCP